jgi:AcrR family transcriptional regulator
MLAAITRCIGKHGLAASTQEVIARETGFSRSHIRHYLGNRDQVVQAVWNSLLDPYREQMARAVAQEDPAADASPLLDFLFGPEMERKPEDRAIEAIIDGSQRHPELRAQIERTYREVEETVSRHLQSLGTDVDADAADDVAFSIVSLAFGASSLSEMGFPQSRWAGARVIAGMVVSDLIAGRTIA